MEPAAEQLEVVRAGDKGPEGNESQQPQIVRDGDGYPDCGRSRKRAGGEPDQDAGRDPCLQRPAVQLVEGVRADAEPGEEGRGGELTT